MKPFYITNTPNTFRLQFEYNPNIIEFVKKIPSHPRWDPEDKCWIVQKKSDKYSLDRNAEFYVEALAEWTVRKAFCEKVKRRKSEEDFVFDLPPMLPFEGEHYMQLTPYDYQLEGVRYALDHKRCIFGDQPGLGKTLQAICTIMKAHRELHKYGESLPCLVVCPAALKVNWQREFKKFAGIDAIILDDRNRATWELFYERKNMKGEPLCSVFITNYESLKKFFVLKVMQDKRGKRVIYDPRVKLFNAVILDESHKCRTPNTLQSKFALGICEGKRWVLELTGTPVVNNNTDLIHQLAILDMLPAFGGYRKFTEKFCDGPTKSSRLKELNFRLRQHCFFRREKKDVLTQLPDKTRQYITVDITNRKEYDAAERDIISYLRQYKNADDEKVERAMRGQIMVTMGILKQVAARGKIQAVSEFVHSIIDGGEKLILFAFLKDVIAELKREFPKAVTVTGSDNIQQKQMAVDQFQDNPDCKLIILNYKSGGTGLTLTAASRVAFIEFPWTYSDCEQAEDRAHRNGQKNNVNCYYFLGENTIDKYMYDVIQTKKSIADGVTGTQTQVEEDMINLTMNLFKDKL